MTRVYLFAFILLLISFSHSGFSVNPVVLTDKLKDIEVNADCFEVLRDCQNSLLFSKVKDSTFSAEKLNGSEPDCMGYWLKFTISNQTSGIYTWVLESQDPHTDYLSLFSDSETPLAETGYSLPFFNRVFAHKNFAFRINLLPGQEKTYYLKLYSRNGYGFPFRIRSDAFFIEYSLQEYWLLGMYYGIILIMAIYNLFIYFSVKERVYLYYVFYAISCGLSSFNEDGLGFQYFWPQHPQFNYILSHAGHFLLLTTFLPYAQKFLKLKELLPRFYPYLIISYLVYITVYSLYLTGIAGTRIPFFFFLIPFILVYLSAIKIYRSGYEPAKFFIVGYSLILISLAVFLLRIYGMVPSNLFTVYCFNFGFLTEVVVLSFALGERLRIEKKKKEESQKQIIRQLEENQKLKEAINRDLENKVNERTLELKQSNQKLELTHSELEKAYEKLRIQAREIEKMNKVLDSDNKELKLNLKELAKARVMFKEVKFEEFSNIYPNDEACLKYLSQVKWQNGYACRKCKNISHSEGKTSYSKRCTKCGYEESATAFTIFHRNRIPLTKAFYMVFLVSTHKKEVTSEELSRKLDLRQKTCWSFKQKIVKAINEAGSKKFNPENWGTIFLNHN